MSGEGLGRGDFLRERIAGAQHFDIDEVADQTSPYPHMVPSETEFQDHVGKVSPVQWMSHCCEYENSIVAYPVLIIYVATPSLTFLSFTTSC